MTTQIKLRRDTAANWTSINPVLALGEPGLETDTRKIKYGDGSTVWTALAYSAGDANFSGSYDDLTNKPVTVDGNGQLTTTGSVTIPQGAGFQTANGFNLTGGIRGQTSDVVDTLLINQNRFTIYTNNAQASTWQYKSWSFIEDGSVVFPDASIQSTGWTGSVASSSVTGLATVATSGSYDDLANKPTIVTNLDSLTDVAITTATTGQVLKYNGTNWVNDTDSTGSSADTGNITFTDNTLTGTGDVKIHFTPSASPAVEFNFASNGSLTLPGGIVLENHQVKNTGTLSGEVQITTATTQGDTVKNWTFNHNGAGALIVPEGSSVQSKSNFNITATETGFSKFTNIVDFDTNSMVDDNRIRIVNPVASILDLIDPASANYAGGLGSVVRIVYGPFKGAEGTIIEAFADAGIPDPLTGLPMYEGRIDIVNPSNGDLLKEFSIGHSSNWKFGSDGNTTFPTGLTLSAARGPNTVNFTSGIDKEFQIETQTAGDSRLWNFGTNGWLTTPDNGVIQSNTLIALSSFNNNNDIARVMCQSLPNSARINLRTTLSTGAQKDWIFDADGSLTLPVGGDIKNSSGASVLGGATYDQSLNTTDSVTFNQVAATEIRQNFSRTKSTTGIIVPGATPTVVYSAPSFYTSIKLVIAVEGQLDGDVTNVRHTQTCEATIAATYNTTAEPIISVYGIVYTSSAPLATFTVARNILAGTIEVTAINSQTTNALDVRVHAIQFVSTYD